MVASCINPKPKAYSRKWWLAAETHNQKPHECALAWQPPGQGPGRPSQPYGSHECSICSHPYLLMCIGWNRANACHMCGFFSRSQDGSVTCGFLDALSLRDQRGIRLLASPVLSGRWCYQYHQVVGVTSIRSLASPASSHWRHQHLWHGNLAGE